MKRIINIISITLGIFIFTACQDELNNELFHKFSYLVENGWQTCEVEIKDGNIAELLIDFGINGTSENDKDITLKITNDPDTLADYNFDKFKNQITSRLSPAPGTSTPAIWCPWPWTTPPSPAARRSRRASCGAWSPTA